MIGVAGIGHVQTKQPPSSDCSLGTSPRGRAEQAAIDHHWTGHLGIGENRWPVVKQVEDGLWCAVRMGGMGVAIGCAMGKKLADMMYLCRNGA